MERMDYIDKIENAKSSKELSDILQKAIESFGFSSFGFLDVSNPTEGKPIFVSTHSQEWISVYVENNFIYSDPCIVKSTRQNTPFAWHDLPRTELNMNQKHKKTMDTARDFGFKNGMVVPVHYVDRKGLRYSAVCTLFWKNKVSEFHSLWKLRRGELHVILVYWTQKIVDLVMEERAEAKRFLAMTADEREKMSLTDREKDIMIWSAYGLTAEETADHLQISKPTVHSHIRHALEKLGTTNKMHAAFKAYYNGLIQL